MTFLERCAVCERIVLDADVGDMICKIDGKTCQAVEIELLLHDIKGCDCFVQSCEYENLKDKE